mmetsp:Transcript_33817/g.60591  ORF Transcript_33817/g.60591 Transcript_33817/m.60591 type:complete len:214 (+) Transcript_33817:2811-3452(+)
MRGVEVEERVLLQVLVCVALGLADPRLAVDMVRLTEVVVVALVVRRLLHDFEVVGEPVLLAETEDGVAVSTVADTLGVAVTDKVTTDGVDPVGVLESVGRDRDRENVSVGSSDDVSDPERDGERLCDRVPVRDQVTVATGVTDGEGLADMVAEGPDGVVLSEVVGEAVPENDTVSQLVAEWESECVRVSVGTTLWVQDREAVCVLPVGENDGD